MCGVDFDALEEVLSDPNYGRGKLVINSDEDGSMDAAIVMDGNRVAKSSRSRKSIEALLAELGSICRAMIDS